MYDEHIERIIEDMEAWLYENFPTVVPEKIDTSKYLTLEYPSDELAVGHLKFMLSEMKGMDYQEDSDSREKLMRWLGFAQGALWARGYQSIDGFREMNTE